MYFKVAPDRFSSLGFGELILPNKHSLLTVKTTSNDHLHISKHLCFNAKLKNSSVTSIFYHRIMLNTTEIQL